MKKLQVFVSPNSGISYHRFVNPLSYLNMGEEWNVELMWFGEDEHKIDCDVLWFSKYLITEPKWLRKLQDKGTKIIVDIDDNPNLPMSHPFYKKWKDSKRDEVTIENIKLADVVTCSTVKVQEFVRQYNKNTVVIPNAFPYGHDTYQPTEYDQRDKMTFIYSGGSSHYNDVKLLEGKFKRIGSDSYMVNNSEYLLAGYEAQQRRRYYTMQDELAGNNNFTVSQVHGEWDKMAAVFANTNSYRILPSINLDEYLEYYSMADVALIPLGDKSWNRYKSILKVLEASCKKLPVICSKVAPYTELEHCEGIMWVENNNWLDHIKWCIKNPQGVKDKGEQVAEYIWKNYQLTVWNETRKQLLNSLVC